MTEALEPTARLYEQAAGELHEHCRVAAQHFRDEFVPRGAPLLDKQAREHASRPVARAD